MHAFAQSLEIDTSDTKQFFCILSDHGKRTVDIETFVVGCIKLKGQAKSMDLMDLVYAHRQAVAEQHEFRIHCSAALNFMTEKVEILERTLNKEAAHADILEQKENLIAKKLANME